MAKPARNHAADVGRKRSWWLSLDGRGHQPVPPVSLIAGSSLETLERWRALVADHKNISNRRTRAWPWTPSLRDFCEPHWASRRWTIQDKYLFRPSQKDWLSAASSGLQPFDKASPNAQNGAAEHFSISEQQEMASQFVLRQDRLQERLLQYTARGRIKMRNNVPLS